MYRIVRCNKLMIGNVMYLCNCDESRKERRKKKEERRKKKEERKNACGWGEKERCVEGSWNSAPTFDCWSSYVPTTATTPLLCLSFLFVTPFPHTHLYNHIISLSLSFSLSLILSISFLFLLVCVKVMYGL